MKKDDVVSVITLAGEFVGKYQEMIDGQVSLKDPRMLVQGPEGQMGFAKGICSTGVEEPERCYVSSVCYAYCEGSGEGLSTIHVSHPTCLSTIPIR